MKNTSRFKILSLCVIFALGFVHGKESKTLTFEAGMGIRKQAPVVVIGGISYNNLTFRLQGMGLHNGPRDFWCGIRGSLLWKFFKDLPYNLSVGVGSGYEYAQAPNDMHKALNDANKADYLRPYNYKENLDISGEIWASIYGFYTQISIPAYQFLNHNAPRILWGGGYMVEF